MHVLRMLLFWDDSRLGPVDSGMKHGVLGKSGQPCHGTLEHWLLHVPLVVAFPYIYE